MEEQFSRGRPLVLVLLKAVVEKLHAFLGRVIRVLRRPLLLYDGLHDSLGVPAEFAPGRFRCEHFDHAAS